MVLVHEPANTGTNYLMPTRLSAARKDINDFCDFNTVIGSHQQALHRQIFLCDNDVVNHFVRLRLL